MAEEESQDPLQSYLDAIETHLERAKPPTKNAPMREVWGACFFLNKALLRLREETIAKDAVIVSLSDRVASQSEILSRKAEALPPAAGQLSGEASPPPDVPAGPGAAAGEGPPLVGDSPTTPAEQSLSYLVVAGQAVPGGGTADFSVKWVSEPGAGTGGPVPALFFKGLRVNGPWRLAVDVE